MEEVIKLNEVDKYNKLFGLETRHPLVSVIDLSKTTQWPEHFKVNYGVYALYLKDTYLSLIQISVSRRRLIIHFCGVRSLTLAKSRLKVARLRPV